MKELGFLVAFSLLLIVARTMAEPDTKKIPISIITGFLGSGKTTLVRKILESQTSQNIALIENEFAIAFGIENELLEKEARPEEVELKWVYEFGNGCICCSAKGEIGRALHELAQRDDIDRVIIETTGLSGATGNLIDDDLRDRFFLDGIITLIDAKHFPLHLGEELSSKRKKYEELEVKEEAYEQLVVAEMILVNKVDLVGEEELQEVLHQIRSINSRAQILTTSYSTLPDFSVLFNIQAVADPQIDFEVFASKSHDPSVQKHVLVKSGTLDQQKLENFLTTFHTTHQSQIFRTKGLFSIKGKQEKVILQGVHGTYSLLTSQNPWKEGEERNNVFVLIGRKLAFGEVEKAFLELL